MNFEHGSIFVKKLFSIALKAHKELVSIETQMSLLRIAAFDGQACGQKNDGLDANIFKKLFKILDSRLSRWIFKP